MKTTIVLWYGPVDATLQKTYSQADVCSTGWVGVSQFKKAVWPHTHHIFSFCACNSLFIEENFLQIPNQINYENGSMIKYLLTEFGQPGWGNIFGSPYTMTSSQIFSCPALPVSQ